MNALSTESMCVAAIDTDSPRLLPQVVGLLFALRLVFVLVAVRVFGQEAKVGVSAGLALNYLLVIVVLFHSIGPASRTLRSMIKAPMARWVILFVGFTGMSLLWSSTASLPAAVAFWCAMVADTIMIALLLRTGPIDVVVNAIMAGYIWGTSMIALLAWVMPSQTDLRLGDEELLGPNQIGYACAFAFFFVQYIARLQKGLWYLHGILLAVTMLRSLSKTTIVAFVVAQAYVLMRDRRITRRTKRFVVLTSVVVLLVFSGLLVNYYDVYTHAGNQSETLTGRVGIWAYILNEAVQQPWIGHGFHSVWKVIPPFGIDQFEARHAHNELLQQFYAYGVVGVAMMIAIYGSVFRHIRRTRDASLRVFCFSLLIFVLVRGFADTEAFDLSLPMWMIVILGCLIERTQTKAFETRGVLA